MKRVKRDGGLKRREFLKMSLAAAGAATLGAGVSAPAIGQQTRTIRFGHMLPTDQIHHKAIAMFGEELAKLSSNKMKVEIFPSSQLGSIAEMLQSVQAGSLTMSMAVPAWYSSFMKPLDAFTQHRMGAMEVLNPLRSQVEGVAARAEGVPAEVAVPVPVQIGAVVLLEGKAPPAETLLASGNLRVIKHDALTGWCQRLHLVS